MDGKRGGKKERERTEWRQWERQRVGHGTKGGENLGSAFVGGEVSLENKEGDGK